MFYPSRASIIERARRYLAAVPPAVSGSGGHDATFHAACVLVHGFGLTVDEARPILHEWNARCLPPWHVADLEHKLVSADSTPANRPRGYLLNERERACPPPPWSNQASLAPTKQKPWPDPDPAQIAVALKDGPTALQLWERSPVRLDEDDGSNCAAIMRALFTDADQPDPLLCVGKSSREFATRPLSVWLTCERLADFSFVVPAHMTARAGHTKAGKVSEHTLENTGPRRFVVVEFDTGTTDEHAARIWHLDGYARLALVVHSGGKSLHAWFPIAGYQPEEVRRFMEYAALLGADTKLFSNPSQFVRLPGGTREGGCRQSVFYDAVGNNSQDVCSSGEAIK